MYYNVRCTYTEMLISDFSKNLSKMFQIYSELCLLTYRPGRYGKEAGQASACRKEGNHRPSTPPRCRLISERDRPGILIPVASHTGGFLFLNHK